MIEKHVDEYKILAHLIQNQEIVASSFVKFHRTLILMMNQKKAENDDLKNLQQATIQQINAARS